MTIKPHLNFVTFCNRAEKNNIMCNNSACIVFGILFFFFFLFFSKLFPYIMSNEEIDNVFVPLLLFVFPFELTPLAAAACILLFLLFFFVGCCCLPFRCHLVFVRGSFFVLPVLIIARLHIIIFALCLFGGVCVCGQFVFA